MPAKKTAYWIKNTHLLRQDEFVCSFCKSKAAKPSAICPHCGSNMKGTKSDTGWVDEMEAIDAFFDD
ncbi:MAG: hypothetical protein J5643_09560 [Lachnospiraceae bacterium]|nr:hypothetical protein [Lachnospiraceae bacterium]